MAVTANQQISFQVGDRGTGPIEAATTLYEGTLCFSNSSGRIDDDVASGVNKFVGIAIKKFDNSSGDAEALDAEFYTRGRFLLTGSGFTQGSVDSDCYASDNFTITTSSSSTSYIGRIVQYVSATQVWVDIKPGEDPQSITEVDLDDDEEIKLGTSDDALLLFSTGDADNHALVVAVDDTSQQMHITDNGAKATDWARTAGTHPELAIHSNTTPATDYLAIGNHDGTTATIDVVGGTRLNLDIAGTTALALTATAIKTAAGTDLGSSSAELGDIYVGDDKSLILGADQDVELIFSSGDASNPALVLALDNTSQQMHITDKAAVATDWVRSAGTHPEVAIHSNTTPATDYLAIGNHDGTTASIDVVGGTTLSLAIAGASIATITADGVSLVVDDDCYFAGASADCGFGFMDADASNPTMVIFTDDTSQQIHVTDKAAKDTDWNLVAGTHPTVYVHSNTTPATDYLSIGGHDGTTATIDVGGGTTLALAIAGAAIGGVKATGVYVGTYVEAGTTAGDNQLTLQSTGTAPTGTGANVGHLYADYETDDDELFWLSGTGGTATQLTT